jgi:hypothetical protein
MFLEGTMDSFIIIIIIIPAVTEVQHPMPSPMQEMVSSFLSNAGNISHIQMPSPPDLLAKHQALVCTSINIKLINNNKSLALSQMTGNHCSQFLSTSVTIT